MSNGLQEDVTKDLQSSAYLEGSVPVQEEDWNLPMDFDMFAKHERQRIYFFPPDDNAFDAEQEHRREYFEVECVERLTPLDMMSLSSGVHDSTGHCVWTGAFWLIAGLQHPTMKRVFDNRQLRVIELGCGTGIGGLAVLLYGFASFVLFTDADPEALALCERNCAINLSDAAETYRVQALEWGQSSLPDGIFEQYAEPQRQFFDVVLATDVLYDIGALPNIFDTAARCLPSNEGGYFVLSHVPRACYNSQNMPPPNLSTDSGRDLEQLIVERAREFGFVLETIVRPSDMRQGPSNPLPADALNNVSLQEMDQVGAAILVFRKRSGSREQHTPD